MGRPTKYSDETVEKVCEGIRIGLTYELAAGYAGISLETFRQWREKKPAFLAAVSEAEAEGAAESMQHILDARRTDWRSAAWIMEHRHGYSAKTDLNVNGDGLTTTVEIVLPPSATEGG